jgi:hypothetical protein
MNLDEPGMKNILNIRKKAEFTKMHIHASILARGIDKKKKCDMKFSQVNIKPTIFHNE